MAPIFEYLSRLCELLARECREEPFWFHIAFFLFVGFYGWMALSAYREHWVRVYYRACGRR